MGFHVSFRECMGQGSQGDRANSLRIVRELYETFTRTIQPRHERLFYLSKVASDSNLRPAPDFFAALVIGS